MNMWAMGAIGSALAMTVATPQAAPAPNAAPAAARECRESALVTADGRQGTIRYCRDDGGVWRRVGGIDPPAPPFPARASLVFSGTYRASARTPGPPVRRLDLRSLLASAGSSRTLEGAITFAMRIEGAAATATVTTTGGLSPMRLSGLARDGQCRLVDARQEMLFEGRCDRKGFDGVVKTTGEARVKVDGRFSTRASEVTPLD